MVREYFALYNSLQVSSPSLANAILHLINRSNIKTIQVSKSIAQNIKKIVNKKLKNKK